MSAPPAGRTALWAEPPEPAERKLRLAYLPEQVLINSGFYIILDSSSLCSPKLTQLKNLILEYRCDINQAFYVTAAPYSVQNHAFTGELLHKTDILCHSDLYSTLQKKRPSTKSPKNCRTVLFYGAFELFWPPSIMKMASKMMDGFKRDTICQ